MELVGLGEFHLFLSCYEHRLQQFYNYPWAFCATIFFFLGSTSS
uniref:Uncharacterized protein n=1 Tax=Triticum urartu TaxID=4572 RepID=A0A8R7UG02_TRIUA